MCGLIGFLRFNNQKVEYESLWKMCSALSHRGPDNTGIYIADGVGLGHLRLKIIDLDNTANQPMFTEDGRLALIFNGEIYNFVELRRELKEFGYRFSTSSDTEVILHSYLHWGTSCVDRFNGMFAFCIWDSLEKTFFVARDRIGIKPLFFSQTPDFFLVASEIKGILASGLINRKINPVALSYFLSTNWIPAPHSLFQGINQLLPGHCMLLEKETGQCRKWQYWRPDIRRDMGGWSVKKASEEFDDLLCDSVRLRMRSDVDFGAFLSGGLDSSSIVYMMRRIAKGDISTFSFGFEEESFDESSFAKSVSGALQTKNHSFRFSGNLPDLVKKIVYHAEEPTADSSMVAVYELARETRKFVKVCLSGDGADELFAGYETYQASYLSQLYKLIPSFIRMNFIEPIARRIEPSESKIPLEEKLKRFISGAGLDMPAAHGSWRSIFDPSTRRSVMSPVQHLPGAQADILNLYRWNFSQLSHLNNLDKMLYVDTVMYLPSDMLVKIDRMTMAHGLEARVPFLDHRIAEFAFSLPKSMKLKCLYHKKWILKQIMKGKLDSDIIYRKKAGFNMPLRSWVKGPLKEFLYDTLSKTSVSRTGFLDSSVVTCILNEHFSGSFDRSHQIWNLMVLVLWHQIFFREGGLNIA